MRHIRTTAASNPKRAVLQVLAMPILAVRRHRAVFRTVCTTVLLVLATTATVLTVQYWSGASFALALEYDGQPIGYIADEQVYADAVSIVRDAVVNTDGSFEVNKSPVMRVEILKENMVLLDADAVSQRVLEKLGGDLVYGSGLFVNDVFQGALVSRNELDEMMTTVLKSRLQNGYDSTVFYDKVEVVDAVYPKSSLVSSSRLKTYLGTLVVAQTKTVTRVVPLQYKVVEREDKTAPLDYREEIQKGVAGEQEVEVYELYVNGTKQSEEVLSTTVLKEAKDQIYLVGKKTYAPGTEVGDGVAKDKFVWPLPYTKNITSEFASRWGSFHGAIDIAGSNTYGKPIIASNGGVVVEAEWHNSWGYYVLIDHGNGFKTRYAHCSKLEVKAGDKVAQGQYIAKVGDTGYSFGAHLHFEVIKNGQLVNPLDYVER